MIAILRFYDFRYFFRVIEIECHSSEFRHILRTSGKSEFSATRRRHRVLAIQDGKRRKFALTLVDTFGIVAQACLYILDLLAWDGRSGGKYLNLDRTRHERYRILRQLVEITAHIRRCRLLSL